MALGGALGTVLRVVLTEHSGMHDGLIAVMAANIAGTCLLAALTAYLLAAEGRWARLCALAAGTGFCGALTTYSGLVLEALLRGPGADPAHLTQLPPAQLLTAGLVLLVCALAGLAAAAGGWRLGAALRRCSERRAASPRPGQGPDVGPRQERGPEQSSQQRPSPEQGPDRTPLPGTRPDGSAEA